MLFVSGRVTGQPICQGVFRTCDCTAPRLPRSRLLVGFKLESPKTGFLGQKSQVLNGGVVYLPYGKLLGCPWKLVTS